MNSKTGQNGQKDIEMTNQQSNEIRNQKQKFEISTAQMVQTHHETKFVKIDLNHLKGDSGASEGSSLKDLKLMGNQ